MLSVERLSACAPSIRLACLNCYAMGPMSAPHRTVFAIAALLLAAGCQPTVQVEAPKEPITINLNVKVDAEVRVKLEEQAEKDIENNPEIF